MTETTYKLGYVAHLSEEGVHYEISNVGNGRISDACAVTIASWYASPGSSGRSFAALATGSFWSLEGLLADIAYSEEHDIPKFAAPTDPALQAMHELKKWAANKAGMWLVTVHFRDGSKLSSPELFYEVGDAVMALTLLKYEDPTSDLPVGEAVHYVEIR